MGKIIENKNQKIEELQKKILNYNEEIDQIK